LFLSPLVFHRETLEVFEYNKIALLRVTAIALMGLGLAAWVGRRWSELWANLRPLLRNPIVWGVVLFLLSAILSTVTSISPRTSFWGAHESYAGLLTMLTYAVLFFATLGFCRDLSDCRSLTLASVLAAAVASVYALLQVAHLDPIAWQLLSDFRGYVRPFAMLGHPNLLAAFLGMVLPFNLYWAIRSARKHRWLLCAALGVAGILAVAVVVLSLSRGGWLALVSVLLVLALGSGWLAGKRKIILAGAGAVLSTLCLIGIAVWFSDDVGPLAPLHERCLQLVEMGPRRLIWQAGVAVFQEHPATGCGLDTFQLAFPAHRTAEYWQLEWNQTPAKAHNELIHVLATQGIVGGIAVVVLLFGLGCALRRAWRQKDRDQREFLIALAASLVGFCVQDFFSFTVAGTGTLFVTLAALLVCIQRGAGGSPTRRQVAQTTRMSARVLQIGIGIAAVALIVVGVLRPWQANCACAQAEARIDDDPTQAAALAEQALTLDDTQDVYWARLGSAEQVRAWRSPDPNERRRNLCHARDAFERALRMVPVNAYYHANVGRVLADLALLGPANPAEAYAEFDAALALDHANAYFYADAGTAALRLGNLWRARNYAKAGLGDFPEFAPLLALLAYVEITEQNWTEADRLLLAAAYADWHDDLEGQNRVAHALYAVRNRSPR
jgi:O-antigen ligase/Tfp pilus assembly protein PilF